jgi:hypothetical protein
MPVAVLQVIERGVTADPLTFPVCPCSTYGCLVLAALMPGQDFYLPFRLSQRVHRGSRVQGVAEGHRDAPGSALRRVGGARRLHGPALTPATESCARLAQNNPAKLQKR